MGYVKGHGAAKSDLDVVGVGTEGEQVDGRHPQDFSQVTPLAGYNTGVPHVRKAPL
jgi:hypothetical protein